MTKHSTPGTEVDTEVEGNTNTSTSVSEQDCSKMKKRNWFLTINNYTENELLLLNNYPCKYIIWQTEIGEKCGTPHLHACIVYPNAVVWPKRDFPRARIEPVISLPDCIKYCSKKETRVEGPFERGERPKQGKRNDLKKLAEEVVKGRSINHIAKEEPDMFVKYGRGLKLLREETQKNRNSENPPFVVWLWGNAGVGKSRIPNTIFSETSIYIKDGTSWWDNYDHEKCILIDDFDGKWPYRDFLRLLDRYKYQGQFKGGYVKINSPFIFITCEFGPSHFWEDNALKQVTRRCSVIHQVTNYETSYEIIRNELIKTQKDIL